MKPRTLFNGWSVLLLLATNAAPADAAQFSADLLDTRGGETTSGTFNYQDKNYRFDVGEGDQTLTIMVDGQSGRMRVLAPAEKAYLEAGPDDPLSLMANPFAAYAHYARTKEVRAAGTEMVDGIPCTKQIVSGMEQVFVVAWVSDEFEFPLKVQTQIDGRTIELRNIRRGPQDPSRFVVPDGYSLSDGPQQPAPEWAGAVAGAPLLAPPVAKTLQEGEIIKLRPQAGRWISVQGTNTGKDGCAFTSVAFKEGRPLHEPSMTTVNLEAGDSATLTHSEKPDEADEIVVRVGRGTVKLTIALVASRDAAPTAATEINAAITGPDDAPVATRVEVAWTGPANSDDFISVALPGQPPGAYVSRTLVREGNPVKLWTPSDPGDYEVRYVLGRGAKVLATAPITVTAVAAEVTPPGQASVAERIEVGWTGPAADGDFISVARPEHAPGAYVSRTLVREGNPVKVWTPSDPGDYEVRYVLGRGARMLATAPITVTAVAAEVQPPAEAGVAALIEIPWIGPAADGDFISVARPDHAPGAYVSRALVRDGNPAKVRTPNTPGHFEVRYVLGRGNRVLAKATITVEAP